MQKVKLKSTPVIYKNKDFQSIIVKVMFPFEEKIKDLAKIQLLPSMLNHMNNKYPSEELLQLERKRLYILGAGCSRSIIGTTGVFSFNLVIPDTDALGKDILEKQFEFFSELIYNPRIEDEGFSKFEFEREVNNLRLGISNALKNVRPYHQIKLRELVDDDTEVLSRDIVRHQELIDEVTPSNLYDYYLNVIKNNQPVIYVMGNVDDEKINELCNKYLYRKKYTDKEYIANLYYYLEPREKVQEIEENSKFKDSVFSVVYKVKDMKQEDVILLNTLRNILTSLSSRLLGEKLRDESELIYSSRVVAYPHFGIFEITVYINKENITEVKEKLEEVIQEFKNEEVIGEALKNILERKRINLLRKLDDKYYLFEDFILKDLDIDKTAEEYFEMAKKVTAKDISNFVDRLVLDTTYFLKEGENE